MAGKTLEFGPLMEARFVERPNRFVARCALECGRSVRAHVPNSGRLRELFLPGAKLYLSQPGAGAANRKTRYSVVGVEREGRPVFIDTHATNAVARHLIDAGRLPGLEGARVVRAEAACGASRFDFLLREEGREFFAEVKSVTLFSGETAMFPDAPTERGRRHLLELAERPGPRPAVVFIVHSSRARWFVPDYHTDLAFARTLLDVRERLRILPVGVGWSVRRVRGRDDAGLRLVLQRRVRLLDVPWEYVEREARDGGAYLVVLRLARARRIAVGKLGRIRFEKGYYVYVGSAMRGLSARLARHGRLRKRMHWHVDYLRREAEFVASLPVRGSGREECSIAARVAGVLGAGPEGFGSSDCRCATHLFYGAEDPVSSGAFQSLVLRLRMYGDGFPE